MSPSNNAGARIYQSGMHFDASAGGADRYFCGLLRGLEEIGVGYTAAAFAEEDAGSLSLAEWEKEGTTGDCQRAERGQRIQRICLGSARQSFWRRRAAVRRFGRHAFSSDPQEGAVLATHFALYAWPMLSQLNRAAHVVHFHGPWASESAQEGARPWGVAVKYLIERRVYASAKRLIVLSGAFRDLLVAQYAIAEEKIAVIPGGVDTARFFPASGEAEKAELRKRLGWPVGKKIIFCVRRMVHRMGLDHLLDAFALIAAAHPDAVLVLGGRGPLAALLEKRAAALGLSERLIFAGFIPDDALRDAYAAADFTIVPSQRLEGFGLVTLESLACGTPSLVTPVGGLPEAVGGLDPSLILSGSSVETLAEGLHRGLALPLPSSSCCREYVEKNFAWPQIAGRVNAVYREAAL